VVSAMMATLACCTPAWRRVQAKMHDYVAAGFLRISKTLIDKNGEGPPDFPRKAVEMLERGKIKLETDRDFVKAKATRFLLDYTWMVFNHKASRPDCPQACAGRRGIFRDGRARNQLCRCNGGLCKRCNRKRTRRHRSPLEYRCGDNMAWYCVSVGRYSSTSLDRS
jgi:hypothetical protein